MTAALADSADKTNRIAELQETVATFEAAVGASAASAEAAREAEELVRKQKEEVRRRQMQREIYERERAGLLNIRSEYSGSEASEQPRSTGRFGNDQIATLPKAYFEPHLEKITEPKVISPSKNVSPTPLPADSFMPRRELPKAYFEPRVFTVMRQRPMGE